MISPTRCLIVLALVLGCADLHSQASSQTKPIKKVPAGSISGRITLQGKGKAGIVVGLGTGQGGPQAGPLFKATTDADGNYRITEVPAGFYHVAPMAPNFVVPDVNMNPYGPRGKALELAEGEIVEDIDFSIARGAVITGKVTHADGRPVVEERITATFEEQINPRGSLYFQSLPFQTDDRGIYRIYGLLAGRYKVSVGQADDAFFTTVNRGRPAFERVFYPDVSNANEAKVIELTEGGEATNIDITVGKNIQGFAATGVIVDGETNQPLANVRFGLQRVMGENRSSMGTNATSNQQGEFRIDNVPPGKYSVFILPQPNSQVQADPVPFEVVDQDVVGITLRTSTGTSISGTVVVEGTSDKSILARIARFRLQTYIRSEGTIGGGFQRSLISVDGSFRLGGLPAGTANFSLAAEDNSPPKGFSLTRVEREGVVQPRGLEIKSGEQVSGVRIVFTYATGIVRGSVNIENGPVPTGARVMVWLTKPGDTPFGLRQQEVDSRGHFVIEGVPGGSYDLHVGAFIPGSRERTPSAKQLITVTDGAVTDVVLAIDLNPKRDPSPTP